MTRPRQPGTGRTQVRVGGRWAHKKSARVARVTRILYPHFVEYKYERPTRTKSPWHGYMTTDPYTRRTRVPYRVFVLGFERPRAA